MVIYDGKSSEQFNQVYRRRELLEKTASSALKLLFGGMALSNVDCRGQYRQEKIPAMGLESHLKFQRLVKQALSQKGVLDSFSNPLDVSEEELYNWCMQKMSEFTPSNSLLDCRVFFDKRLRDYEIVFKRQLGYSLEKRLREYEIAVQKEHIAPIERRRSYKKNLLEAVLYKGWNYGALDMYLNWENISKGNLGKIAEGVIFYPLDFAFDMGIRSPKAIFWDIPREAWRRAMKAADLQEPKNVNNDIIKVGLMPIQLATGALNLAYNCGAVVVEGAVKQATKRPLETATHIILSAILYETIRKARDGGKSKVIVVEESAPWPAFPDARPRP